MWKKLMKKKSVSTNLNFSFALTFKKEKTLNLMHVLCWNLLFLLGFYSKTYVVNVPISIPHIFACYINFSVLHSIYRIFDNRKMRSISTCFIKFVACCRWELLELRIFGICTDLTILRTLLRIGMIWNVHAFFSNNYDLLFEHIIILYCYLEAIGALYKGK